MLTIIRDETQECINGESLERLKDKLAADGADPFTLEQVIFLEPTYGNFGRAMRSLDSPGVLIAIGPVSETFLDLIGAVATADVLCMIGASQTGKTEAMRALIEATYDGCPPYDPTELESAGREYRQWLVNEDFGGVALMEAARRAFLEPREDAFTRMAREVRERSHSRFEPVPTVKEELREFGLFLCADGCGATVDKDHKICPRCCRQRNRRAQYRSGGKWRK